MRFSGPHSLVPQQVQLYIEQLLKLESEACLFDVIVRIREVDTEHGIRKAHELHRSPNGFRKCFRKAKRWLCKDCRHQPGD